MKILKPLVLLSVIFLTSCTNNISETKKTEVVQEVATTTQSIPVSSVESVEPKSTQVATDKPQEPVKEIDMKNEETSLEKTPLNVNIAQETKDYILNGQLDKSEAEKVKWNELFLDQVDIDSVYQQYLLNGGKADDIESFSLYLSSNAPIPGNWQDLVTKDLFAKYEEKATKFELLEDNLYQVYVVIDGKEVPYVVVSSRTGYFHG